jgi:hypothetical protein
MSVEPWGVEGCWSYRGRNYWVLWQRNPAVYGGRQYLMSKGFSDRKRFYDEAKAEAAAAKLNERAAIAATTAKVKD